jgi:hypothetical protein
MSKRILVSEEEKSRILNLHEDFKKQVIKEDDIEGYNFTRAIQRFLNERLKSGLDVDGKMGDNTGKAISKYQQSIGVLPDGKWGPDTWSKMTEKDKIRLKDIVAEEGGLIDKFINWVKKLI